MLRRRSFLQQVLRGAPFDGERSDLDRCRALRAELASSTDEIGDVMERAGGGQRSTVAEESRRASVPEHKGRLLYRLVRVVRPAKVVEFGSALGVSGSYLAAALARTGHGSLVTIEGSPSRQKVAARAIERVAPGRATSLCALFDEVLDELENADLFFLDGNHHLEPSLRYLDEAASRMSKPGLVVLDDIGWSSDMTEFWRRGRRDPRFRPVGEEAGVGLLLHGDTVPWHPPRR